MNSIHDLGGMDGFGPVRPEPEGMPFHETWEGRVYAMHRAMSFVGLWSIDQSRASIEAMDPIAYLANTYYQKWFAGLAHRLQAHGLVDADELEAGRALRSGKTLPRTMSVADVAKMKRGNFDRTPAAEPLFKMGDQVRTRNLNPVTHTRLPRYARYKVGTIEANRGCHVYPDTAATGASEHPQWLYTVVFPARELWGDEADPLLTISIEAFEPYLMPA
jgi:nitrile hydratase subunit beta